MVSVFLYVYKEYILQKISIFFQKLQNDGITHTNKFNVILQKSRAGYTHFKFLITQNSLVKDYIQKNFFFFICP